MTDQEIIRDIIAGGSPQEACMNYLFDHHRGLIGSALKRHQLSEEEALDAFSDTLLAFRKQVLGEKFRGESKISTYLYTIFSRRCVDYIRKRATNRLQPVIEYPDLKDESSNAERQLITQEAYQKLLGFMNQLGEVCQKILMYRYYWGYEDMEEIADLAGVKNANTAGSLRYRCMKQLMKIIDRQ